MMRDPSFSQGQRVSACELVVEWLEEVEEVHVLNRQILKKVLSTVLPTGGIAFAVMLALMACTGNMTSMAHSSSSEIIQGQRVFAVSSRVRPTVILRGNAGQMHVAVGAPGRVTIKYVVRHTGGGKPATVAYGQDTRANSVTAREIDYPRVGSSNDQVDFTVTVPQNTNLDFTTSAGSISATGTKGRASLISHAGSINADHILLDGRSRLITQSGSVRLSGNVVPGSSCEIRTTAGTVDAFFPRSARLSISASLVLGKVSSDFPTVSASSRGASGAGRVVINVHIGKISIHKV